MANLVILGTANAIPDADHDGFLLYDSPIGDDCDDTDPSVHPGATEVCDAADTDEDCDGSADETGAGGETTWYADLDGDGSLEVYLVFWGAVTPH